MRESQWLVLADPSAENKEFSEWILLLQILNCLERSVIQKKTNASVLPEQAKEIFILLGATEGKGGSACIPPQMEWWLVP